MAKSSTEKYKLSMAGEYGVCAELCKRGYDASITFGNMKATDIIILMPDKTYRRIEVKTSRETRFVTGFFQKYFDKSRIHPDFWVLVQIDEENNSHYYILTHEEMGEVQMKRNEMDKWEKIDGCDNVLLRDLDPFKEQWDKFESIKENT